MKGCSRSIVLVLGCVGAACGTASAAITGGTGATQQISPPANCFPGFLPTGGKVFVWDEQQSVPVTLGLPVDMTVNPSVSTTPTPGAITGLLDAHFMHFDHMGQASGTVTFSGQIVGVAFTDTFLDISDPAVGALGTIYPTGVIDRGMLSLPFLNSVLSINGSTLTYTLDTVSPVLDFDQVRVYTRTVPAPGALGVLGAAGVMVRRRRR
ncbi:MAG: hypothetical protein R3B68_07585 [Phycisphaerales bacterium]